MFSNLVDVLDNNFEDTTRFCETWSAVVPELEFVPARDARALLRSLDARRPASVVIRVTDEQSRGFVSELARRFPTLPLLVLGATESEAKSHRSAPLLSVLPANDPSIERFFRDDVLGATRGAMSGVALSSIIQLLAIERRTCALRVRNGQRSGVLIVRTGALVHAEYGARPPIDAALRMLSWSNTEVLMEPAPATVEHTINLPIDFLLLESARLQDESRNAPENSVLAPNTPQSAVGASPSSSGEWVLAQLHPRALRIVDAATRVAGVLVAELVDVERKTFLAQHVHENVRAVSSTLISTLADVTFSMLAERESSDWVEEIVVRFSSRFKIVRPLPESRKIVVCVVFDPKQISVGLASVLLSKSIAEVYELSAP